MHNDVCRSDLLGDRELAESMGLCTSLGRSTEGFQSMVSCVVRASLYTAVRSCCLAYWLHRQAASSSAYPLPAAYSTIAGRVDAALCGTGPLGLTLDASMSLTMLGAATMPMMQHDGFVPTASCVFGLDPAFFDSSASYAWGGWAGRVDCAHSHGCQ